MTRDLRRGAPSHRLARRGLSLLELTATLGVLGLLAMLIIPRVGGLLDANSDACCQNQRAQIELQALRWKRNQGQWPAGDLSDIAMDQDFFPLGLPQCPVDGQAYSIDGQGRVQGHAH